MTSVLFKMSKGGKRSSFSLSGACVRTLKIMLVSMYVCLTANGQLRTENGYVNFMPAFNNYKGGSGAAPDTVTTLCTGSDTFWGHDVTSNTLVELMISNNTITSTGRSIPVGPGASLAISNNLNGGPTSPTFYKSQSNSNFYWNSGSSWTSLSSSGNILVNAGGYGNNLYYLNNITYPFQLIKYHGTIFTLIRNLNKDVAVADVAVDATGNSYVVTSMPGAFTTDSICIISPAGQIINQYPFVIDFANLYGSFLNAGRFYIGAGIQNQTYPNKILQVSFTASAAHIDTVLSLPGSVELTGDLAGCNPGLPLALYDTANKYGITITTDATYSIMMINSLFTEKLSLSVYTTEGKILIRERQMHNRLDINIGNWESGIYIIDIAGEDLRYRTKFLKY